jgi:peptidoglycan/xylan/chitin deacetylase (PgdA/CDA1 family)
MRLNLIFNSYLRKFFWIINDPYFVVSYVLGKYIPSYFRFKQRRALQSMGIRGKYFILSFDCDTTKDIEVVESVHNKLKRLGITPSYAVPGELLLEGRDIYKKLYADGAEFINHGYQSHTSYSSSTNSYVSTLFYEKLSDNQVAADVSKGHDTFYEVFGKRPSGFRTPHFGGYQSKKNLIHLYSVLEDLGYKFSTSTSPVVAMWNGPIIRQSSGILEIPVSGCYDYPARILDSWGFRFSPTRKLTEKDYLAQFKKIIEYLNKSEGPEIFNIYADPSQVYDWPEFFECMALTNQLQNISFVGLVEKASR